VLCLQVSKTVIFMYAAMAVLLLDEEADS
jgi:hypothetical protein